MDILQSEHDAIVEAVERYVDGCKEGRSELMRPAFHPAATFFGYAGGSLVSGIETLYAWIDGNGPVAGLETRIANVDIVESIAVVRLEGSGWSGVLAGPGPVHITDVLTLLREPEGGWRILQKVFHWHAAI